MLFRVIECCKAIECGTGVINILVPFAHAESYGSKRSDRFANSLVTGTLLVLYWTGELHLGKLAVNCGLLDGK